MRIAHVTNLYVPHNLGGAEVNCFELVGHQRRAGHDVQVFTNEQGRSFEDPGVRNLDTAVDPVTTALLFPQKPVDSRLLEALKAFRPDVVHVHNVHRTLGFGVYGVAANWPNVVTIQDYHLFCLRTENYREEGRACNDRSACSACAAEFYPAQVSKMAPQHSVTLERLPKPVSAALWRTVPSVRNTWRATYFNRWIDKVICPSAAVRNTMLLWGIQPEKIRIVGNAVPLENLGTFEQQPRPKASLTIGYIGKLTRAKGVHVLIGAYTTTFAPDSGARLLIAGDGDDAEPLREQAAGRADVVFLGRIGRRDIDKFYDESDIVSVPSIWPDVMPLVVLEAMARGKAVIVSDIGGMPDQVGNAGVVVPSNDATALGAALLALERPGAIADLGAAARRRFESEYEPAVIVKQTESVYAEALAVHGTTKAS